MNLTSTTYTPEPREMAYTPDAIAWVAHWAVQDNDVQNALADMKVRLSPEGYAMFEADIAMELLLN